MGGGGGGSVRGVTEFCSSFVTVGDCKETFEGLL